jgi:hypothetical protein
MERVFRWLKFRFGKPPVNIHRVAFYPWRDGWHDVVIDFEKDHPESVGVDSVQFNGWVRWLTLAEQPLKFTLAANKRIEIRFGAISPVDFEAFLVRLRDKGSIKVRLALSSGTTSTKRLCTLPRNAIDHDSKTAWPPRAAVGV